MNVKTIIKVALIMGWACLSANAGVMVSTTVAPGLLNEPYSCAEDTNGNVYISDSANNRIVKFNAATSATTVLAGVTGVAGSNNGPAQGSSPASFFNPQGVLYVTISGTNGLLVADSGNNLIRFVRLSDGYVTTLAGQNLYYRGTTNESGANATFDGPLGMDQDAAGNVYIADELQNAIRVMNLNDPSFGITNLVLTDGTTFRHPKAVAVGGPNLLWVADSGNNGVKLIALSTPASGSVTTYLGESRSPGTTDALVGSSARFNNPGGLLWLSGLGLLISDTGDNSIRLATNCPAYGTTNYAVSTFAGTSGSVGDVDGDALDALFSSPGGLCSDPANGAFLVADLGNNAIRRIQYGLPIPSNLAATSVFGAVNLAWTAVTNAVSYNVKRSSSGTGPFATVGSPATTSFTDTNVLNGATYFYVVSAYNGAGEGLNSQIVSVTVPVPTFNGLAGIAYDGIDNFLYGALTASNSVELLNLNNNSTTKFLTAANGITNPVAVLVDANANVFVLNQGTGSGYVLEFDKHGNAFGSVLAGLNRPTAMVEDGNGVLFVAEQGGGIFASGGAISSVIVMITNANVSLQGIALFDDGTLAVSDAGNHVIWNVNPTTKTVSVLTGQLGVSGPAVGAAGFAQLNQPQQLVRVSGDQVIGADAGNNRLVLVQRSGSVTTNLNVAPASLWYGAAGDPVGTNSSYYFAMASPYGVAVDASGNVYDSEPARGAVRGLAGLDLVPASSVPGVILPVYSNPTGLAFNDEQTILYITDPTNNTVTALDLADNETTLFLSSADGINHPVDVAVDNQDNLYVLSQGTGGNGTIDEFDPYGNRLATNALSLNLPTAVKLDYYGDLYVAESGGLVQEFTVGGVSNNLAIINTNANVQLAGLALLNNGAVVVSDAGNQVIWEIPDGATSGPVVLTGVLDTSGTNFGALGYARLNHPAHLAAVMDGGFLIADTGNNRVLFANNAGTVTGALNSTNAELWFGLASDPVSAGSSKFVAMVSPVGLAIGPQGVVYDSESGFKVIRGILDTTLTAPSGPPAAPLNFTAAPGLGMVTLTWSASSGATAYYLKRATSRTGSFELIEATSVVTFADTNVQNGATYYYVVSALNSSAESSNSDVLSVTVPVPGFAGLSGIAYDGVNSYLYSANASNNTIRRLNLATAATTTFLTASNGVSNPVAILVDTNANVFVLNQGSGTGSILKFDQYGNFFGVIMSQLPEPTAFTEDGNGVLYVAEKGGAVVAVTGTTSNLVTTVPYANVSLQGIALFDDGTLAVSDAGNNVIWLVNPITRVASLLAGQLGQGGAAVGVTNFAQLNQPRQLARLSGDQLVGADAGNNRLVLVQRNARLPPTLTQRRPVCGMVPWGTRSAPTMRTMWP